MTDGIDRRPLKTRSQKWPHEVAQCLVRLGITPNQVSLASIAFAAFGAGSYWWSNQSPSLRPVFLLAAAAFVQLRLLANLLDGLMAVEGGKRSSIGVVYNEFPDRVADVFFFVAAGYAAGWPELGWTASVLAVLTAYVRAFGASLGFAQDFQGPMAKQHRMAFLTAGTLLSAILPGWPILGITLAVIVIGTAVTIGRRTYAIGQKLHGR